MGVECVVFDACSSSRVLQDRNIIWQHCTRHRLVTVLRLIIQGVRFMSLVVSSASCIVTANCRQI